MAKYRSAMGKIVDMSALAAKNERTRAVGNMRVNARGDTIDAAGRIIKAATSKVNENYSKTVGNRSAQSGKVPRKGNDPIPQRPTSKPATVKQASAVNQKVEEELTQMEKELEEDLDYDLEVERIKSKETDGK